MASPEMDLGSTESLVRPGGGEQGLGRAIADELVAEGARRLLVARTRPPLDRVVSELGARRDGLPRRSRDAPKGSITAVRRCEGDEPGRPRRAAGQHGRPARRAHVARPSDEQWDGAYRSLIGNPIRLIRGATAAALRRAASILFVTSSSARVPIGGSRHVQRPPPRCDGARQVPRASSSCPEGAGQLDRPSAGSTRARPLPGQRPSRKRTGRATRKSGA